MRIKPRRIAVVGIVSPMCNFGLLFVHHNTPRNNRNAHKTTPNGGGRYELLNGAGLFSTVVKPRANLDTPSAYIFAQRFTLGE